MDRLLKEKTILGLDIFMKELSAKKHLKVVHIYHVYGCRSFKIDQGNKFSKCNFLLFFFFLFVCLFANL